MRGSAVRPPKSCELSGDEERREWGNLLGLSHFTKAIRCHLMWFMRVHMLLWLLLIFGAINEIVNATWLTSSRIKQFFLELTIAILLTTFLEIS